MKWIPLFLILAIAASGCKESSAPSSQKKNVQFPAGEIGSLLPIFEADDIRGGKIVSTDLKDKVTLIDFWATWCAPCKKEMPGYQTLVDLYGPRGLAVIGFKVDFMQDTEDPMRFVQELGVHYPIAIGDDEIRKQFGGIQGLPTTFIYDRSGVLRYKVIGFEYTREIEAILKPLL
jgi:thiol-disulfide isomerase/thioredoxin